MKSMLRIAAAAVATLILLPAVAEAKPRPSHKIVTCDLRGCSDWHASASQAPRRAAKAPSRGPKAASSPRRAPAPPDANGNLAGRSVVVPTAAGIDIRVAPQFAAQAQAVIADLVSGGYRPKRITCLSYAPSHVKGSYHGRSGGLACDVDQCGWGCSPVPKALMRAATARAGVRDGCEFRDHGHFDLGPHLQPARILRNCGATYAEAVSGRRRLAARGPQ